MDNKTFNLMRQYYDSNFATNNKIPTRFRNKFKRAYFFDNYLPFQKVQENRMTRRMNRAMAELLSYFKANPVAQKVIPLFEVSREDFEKFDLTKLTSCPYPFIVKNELSKSFLAQWTFSALKEQYGDTEIMYQTKKNGVEKYFNEAKGIKMSEFVDRVNNDEDVYCRTNSSFFTGLAPEKILEVYTNCKVDRLVPNNKKKVIPHFFMGNTKGESHFHNAVKLSANSYTLFGTKEWRFIDPRVECFMPIFKQNKSQSFTTPFSIDELDSPDCVLHYMSHYKVITEPGDYLYFPSVWWHAVKNYSNNIMVNFRMINSIDRFAPFTTFCNIFTPLNLTQAFRLFVLKQDFDRVLYKHRNTKIGQFSLKLKDLGIKVDRQ